VVRYRVLISGQVQGVYFRAACQRMAWQHSVAGWVRNLDDGRVEAVFEGAAENVQHLLEWARHGPRLAVVLTSRCSPSGRRAWAHSRSGSRRLRAGGQAVEQEGLGPGEAD
jgi:acylphosphatase